MPWYTTLKVDADSASGKFKAYAMTKQSKESVAKDEAEQKAAILKEQAEQQWVKKTPAYMLGNSGKTSRTISQEQHIKGLEARGNGFWIRNLLSAKEMLR